ncbi:MAG: HD domain-containing protein [Bacteroidota bacterium]
MLRLYECHGHSGGATFLSLFPSSALPLPTVSSRFKIFSDPVHGFISVPKGLLLRLIETPEFQRLRRIRQLGLGHLVFPGAEHTRFAHGLGAMALMQQALGSLSEKGTPVTEAEYAAALAAALLHDVGHGPFSHTLEEDLIAPGTAEPHLGPFRHEWMSRTIIERLNDRFGGALDLALTIFDGAYGRPFFESLLSSQLDMDRLDYLRRDSFYTDVAEGVVGVDRIIKTMRVHPIEGRADADIVIEAKGAYAVESYVLSRRLMYWQVYLHKTVIAADHLLRAAFARARACCAGSDAAVLSSSPALLFFLRDRVTADRIGDDAVLDAFCQLDDTDLLYSLKQWAHSADPLLADLARRFVERDLFRTTYLPAEPGADEIAAWREAVAAWLIEAGLSGPEDAHAAADLYFTVGRSSLDAYQRSDDSISILERDGRVRELSRADDVATVRAVAGAVVRHYVCAPKQVALGIASEPMSR